MSLDDAPSDTADPSGSSAYQQLRQRILTGVAITVPLVITLYVLTAALDFVVDALDPFIGLLEWLGVIQWVESVQLILLLVDLGVYGYIVDFLTELIAVGVLLGIVLLVGTVGHHRFGSLVVDTFDALISAIPGVGTVYKSFRRMGDVMAGEDGENFQEVKLVEGFGDEVYVIGFKTSDAPASVEMGAGHERMVSMFLPLAPNPVTGGLLTYIPEDRLHDVDMSIDEAVRSILTSGVATGRNAQSVQPLSLDDIQDATGNLTDMNVGPTSGSDADE